MYRSQQYREVNRAFGPYLPPHPMRGLGAYALAGTCDTEQANLNQANSVVSAQQALVNGMSNSMNSMPEGEKEAFWANVVQPAQQGLDAAVDSRDLAQSALNSCQAQNRVDPYVNPNGGGTTPPPAPTPPSPTPPAPLPAKLTCPSGQVPSADGKSCVKPATPAASSSNTLLIVGGLALLGVGAFILLRKKK
jgi:LPXTG-motif cell wall-anchored protein